MSSHKLLRVKWAIGIPNQNFIFSELIKTSKIRKSDHEAFLAVY